MKFWKPRETVSTIGTLLVRALHAKYDPNFPGATITLKRDAARTHWDNFLTMTHAFGIVRYEGGRLQLSEGELTRLRRELELFGDGYYGVDDLLGVLLKVEARSGGIAGWIVRAAAVHAGSV